MKTAAYRVVGCLPMLRSRLYRWPAARLTASLTVDHCWSGYSSLWPCYERFAQTIARLDSAAPTGVTASTIS